MIDIQKYIENIKTFGKCLFLIYNSDSSAEERFPLEEKALAAYMEYRPKKFPYNELADFFSDELGRYNEGLRDYKIDRLLLEYAVPLAVFYLMRSGRI